LLASTVTILTTSTPSNAQDTMTAQTQTFLSVRPTTVGVGQEILINLWISPAPGAQRQYKNLELIITKPNGATEKIPGIDTYVADGTMWMTWVPDQVGDWIFKVNFPGQYFPAGIYFNGDYYERMEDVPPPPPGVNAYGGNTPVNHATSVTAPAEDSLPITVHVQEAMVPSWPEAPPPTDYWTRPVDEIHREWWPYVGSYPWFGPAKDDPMWNILYPNTNPTYNDAYGFVPWVTGPESAHIVWKRQYTFGGLLGGDQGLTSYLTGSGAVREPQIILAGRGYHSYTKVSENNPASQTYWQCYDIRTGEVFWERPLYAGETAPNLIEYPAGTSEVEGGQVNAVTPLLLSISNGYMRKYNPLTGVMTANVSIAPFTGIVIGNGAVTANNCIYYKNGYLLGVQDLGANASTERYRLINWTTAGTSGNFTTRVVSNTTYARSALPNEFLIDWNVGIGCNIQSIRQGDIIIAMNITGFNLDTGVQIWNRYVNAPQYSGSAQVSDHGKLAVVSSDGRVLAFDLKTGNDAWQTIQLDEPWDATGFGSYSMASAYGQLYWMAMSGIYAIDWNTGKINWKFEKDAPPFETPYVGREGQTVYPFLCAGMCADGKIYVYSNEHTPDSPFFRGLPTVCIDVFTGKEVWSVGIAGGSDLWRRNLQMAIADGYMTMGSRDGNMYVFGKGQSETTVSASQVPLTLGQKALITGTVLDLSPAQPGAPCVSKESVAAQMEQYHIGAPVGGVFSGVMMSDGSYGDVMMVGIPVSLDVIDPNGNYYNIGVVTSDGYSGTFAFDGWTPKVAGLYTITATFMGDESYGSSFATTYLTVAEGSSDTGTSNAVLYAVIGAIIAIIAVGAILGFLIIRKK